MKFTSALAQLIAWHSVVKMLDVRLVRLRIFAADFHTSTCTITSREPHGFRINYPSYTTMRIYLLTILSFFFCTLSSFCAESVPSKANAVTPLPVEIKRYSAHNRYIDIIFESCVNGRMESDITFNDITNENVTLTPKVANMRIEQGVWGDIEVNGDFVPGTCYTLTFKKGIKGILDTRRNIPVILNRDLVVAWVAPDLDSTVDFMSSGTILPLGTPYWELPIQYVNIKDDLLTCTVFQVYPNAVLNVIDATSTGSDTRWMKQLSTRELKLSNVGLNQSGVVGLDLNILNIPRQKPGIYKIDISEAKSKKHYYPTCNHSDRLLVLTNMALFVVADEDGYNCHVRSLTNPEEPVASADISLYSYKHQLLAHRMTDSDGAAVLKLAHNGDVTDYPALVIVRNQENGDVTFLDISRMNRERPVCAGNLMATVFAERGVCRPGDTMTISGMVRNRGTGHVVPNIPLTIQLYRGERKVGEKECVTSEFGCVQTSFYLEQQCELGGYEVRLQTPGVDGGNLGGTSFIVGEFNPDQIEATMKASNDTASSSCILKGVAKYYFGSPVEHGKVRFEVEAKWGNVLPKEHPLSREGFQFGYVEESEDGSARTVFSSDSKSVETASDGTFSTSFDYGKHIDKALATLPLVIESSAFVRGASGTRPVTAHAEMTIHVSDRYIGIKSQDVITTGKTRSFALKALSTSLQEIALPSETGLIYELKKIEWHYVTKQVGDSYRNVWQKSSSAVEQGKIALDEHGAFSIPMTRTGFFQLNVCDPNKKNAVVASNSFWHAAGEGTQRSHSPFKLSISLDSPEYSLGDSAKLTFDSPFDGVAIVTCGAIGEATTSMIAKIIEGDNTIRVPIPVMLMSGAYHVHVELVSPIAPEGFSAVDPQNYNADVVLNVRQPTHNLKVALTGHEQSRGGNTEEITVSLMDDTNHPVAGEVLLWGVDEGILSLTAYQTPDVFKPLFGPRVSPFDARTSYEELYPLLRVVNGRIGGGDISGSAVGVDMQGRHRQQYRPPNVTQLGSISVNDSGVAKVKVKMPQFNGAFRIMAVASSKLAVGSTQMKVMLRDPVTVSVLQPMFVAPGDSTVLSATVFNNELPKGKFAYSWTCDNPCIKFDDDASGNVTLMTGNSASMECKLTIPETCPEGVLNVSLKVRGKKDVSVLAQESIIIRRAMHSIPVSELIMLKLGESRTIQLSDKDEKERLTVGSPVLLLQRHLDWLNDYPYGCLEQTISAAMPQLFLPMLVKTGVVPEAMQIAASGKIQSALRRIACMKRRNGYAMWSFGDEVWMEGTHYALLFQVLAGSPASDGAQLLQTFVNDRTSSTALERAFALYVLSKYSNTKVKAYAQLLSVDNPTCAPLGKFLIAAALMEGNYASEANALWTSISKLDISSVGNDKSQAEATMLQSPIRNTALVLHLLHELPFQGREAAIEQYENRLLALLQADAGVNMTTQEHAWVAISLAEMLARRGAAAEKGKAFEYNCTVSFRDKTTTLNSGNKSFSPRVPGQYTIVNTGNTPMFIRHDKRRFMTREESQKATGRGTGFSVARKYLDAKGREVASCNKGDLITVAVTVNSHQACDNVVVCDLLPANFEIEDENFATRDGHKDEVVEGKSVLVRRTNLERRFDRALWFGSFKGKSTLVFTYRIRAVAAGKSTIPPVQVEAMYAPALNCVTYPDNDFFEVK